MSIWSILTVILMLGVLVTIHELGHFWMAKILKIKVYEVSIFMGPKLLGWNRKGVEYSIRALPFGAFVRYTDVDENGKTIDSDDPDLLINQKRWKRLLVAVAGPFMNALLGILIFTVMNCFTGYSSLDIAGVRPDTQLSAAVENCEMFTPGDEILSLNGHKVWTYLDFYYELENGISKKDNVTIVLRSRETGEKYDITLVPELTTRPMIGVTHYEGIDAKYGGWEIVSVDENQNNGKPVLKVGDYLLAVDGKSVADEDFDEFFSTLNEGNTMTLTYVRNGETYEAECVKTMLTYANDRGVYVLGYDVDSFDHFLGAVKSAALMPMTITNVTIQAVGDVFEGEEEVYNMVSGPVGVTTVVAEVVDDVDDTVSEKIYYVLQLAGIISIGLTFTNMLPIPGLDGIQMVLIIVEMIIGKPLSEKSERVINAVGFVMLICLLLFALASDIIRIIVER